MFHLSILHNGNQALTHEPSVALIVVVYNQSITDPEKALSCVELLKHGSHCISAQTIVSCQLQTFSEPRRNFRTKAVSILLDCLHLQKEKKSNITKEFNTSSQLFYFFYSLSNLRNKTLRICYDIVLGGLFYIVNEK